MNRRERQQAIERASELIRSAESAFVSRSKSEPTLAEQARELDVRIGKWFNLPHEERGVAVVDEARKLLRKLAHENKEQAEEITWNKRLVKILNRRTECLQAENERLEGRAMLAEENAARFKQKGLSDYERAKRAEKQLEDIRNYERQLVKALNDTEAKLERMVPKSWLEDEQRDHHQTKETLKGLYDLLPRYSCKADKPDGCPVCVARAILEEE